MVGDYETFAQYHDHTVQDGRVIPGAPEVRKSYEPAPMYLQDIVAKMMEIK